MPEVVEVLITSQYLLYNFKDSIIEHLKIHGGKYLKKPIDGYNIIKDSFPLKLNDVSSKGKLLYFTFEDKNKNTIYCTSSFGLSGLWGTIREKHSNIEFKVKNGKSLWYTDHRNFGNLSFYTKKSQLDEKLNKKEFDVLRESFDYKKIKKLIENIITKNKRNESKQIVKVLLEQEVNKGICSGIGNYLVAEILYDAKISPHTTLGEIIKNDVIIKRLTHSMKYIIKLSYMSSVEGYMEYYKEFKNTHKKLIKNGKLNQFHKDIKIKNDDEFSFKVYRQNNDPLGNIVKGERILKERTTYWVPSVQK